MADAAVIAGVDGSAFHALLLARDIKARVVMLPRNVPGRLPTTHEAIAVAKGREQRVLKAPLTHVSGHGRRSRLRLDDPAALVAALAESCSVP